MPSSLSSPSPSAPAAASSSPWYRLALAYFGYFGLLGTLNPFLAAVLLERGFPTGAVGLTLAVLGVLTGSMPLLAGALTSRLGLSRSKTFRICAALTVALAITLVVVAPDLGILGYVGLLALLTASYAPLNAVLDASALDLCSRHGWAFGRLRMMGSVGFIVTATGLGHLLPEEGVTRGVHLATAALAGVVGLSAVLLPRAPRRRAVAGSLRQEMSAPVLSPRAVTVLLAAFALHSASFGPYQYGFTLLGRSLHLAPLTIALGWSAGVVSEIVFFGLSSAALRRWGWRRTLAVALVAAPLRWLSLGLFPTPTTYFLAQILHGPSFALYYAAAMAAFNKAAPARRASAQTTFCAMVAGLASGPAVYAAGRMHAQSPLPHVFVAVVVLNVLAAGCFLVASQMPLQASSRALPRARRSRMASRRLACAASRYAVTGR